MKNIGASSRELCIFMRARSTNLFYYIVASHCPATVQSTN